MGARLKWVSWARWAQACFTRGAQKITLVVPVSQRKRQLKSVPPAAGTERSREMRTKGRDEIPSCRRSEEIQFCQIRCPEGFSMKTENEQRVRERELKKEDNNRTGAVVSSSSSRGSYSEAVENDDE